MRRCVILAYIGANRVDDGLALRRNGRLLRTFLVRHPFLDPRAPSSPQRARFFPSSLPKFSRHTGACGFVWSSTEYGENSFLRNTKLVCGSDRLLGRQSNCAWNRLVALVVSSFGSCVDNNDLTTMLFKLLYFSNGDVLRMKRSWSIGCAAAALASGQRALLAGSAIRRRGFHLVALEIGNRLRILRRFNLARRLDKETRRKPMQDNRKQYNQATNCHKELALWQPGEYGKQHE